MSTLTDRAEVSELADSLPAPVARRRTFAIIAHPDAGKTTLTEKLLLFGGAIQLAGAVKARGEQRRAHSDWMKVERERGISVATSVMTFDYGGCTFNLLDTPGHEDFSEDTYRTLTAVDSAVMVIDAAKGIEPQTGSSSKCAVCATFRSLHLSTRWTARRRTLRTLAGNRGNARPGSQPGFWPIGMGVSPRRYDLLRDRLHSPVRSRESGRMRVKPATASMIRSLTNCCRITQWRS